jgi:hypothetical protein
VASVEEETDFSSTPDPRRLSLRDCFHADKETKVFTWRTKVPRVTPVALKQDP